MKRRGVQAPPELKEEQLVEVRRRAEHIVRSSLLLKEVAVKERISVEEDGAAEG